MPADVGAFALLAPLVVWSMLFALLCWRGFKIREAFLAASIIWGMAVTLLTELPSLWNGLNYPSLVTGWVMLVLLIIPFLLCSYQSRPARSIPDSVHFSNNVLILFPIAVIIAVTLLIALIAPPNNFDSMTYHMPRLMHWIQNGTVAHYPTNILRQLEMSPWAEYAILHLQLLSGGDYFANLVQWFSMVGCIIAATLIADHCNVSSGGQALSGFLVATIFMGILQASSTQNDLVVSFWLICFAYFGLQSLKGKSVTLILLMSCSLGLAILTKGTAYIFAMPFVVWFLIRGVTTSWRQTASMVVLLGVTVLTVNGGHYFRNIRLFHNPLNSGVDSYSNSYLSVGVVASNITRNIALHLVTPSSQLNRYGVNVMRKLHVLYGVDLNDPATTWPGTSFDEHLRLAPLEDSSGNPLHLCLYLAIAAICLGKKSDSGMRWYTVSVMAGFLLFCVALRWQPWHSRLQLPLFVLFAPIAATVIAGLHRKYLIPALVCLFFLATLPWLFCNVSRPLLSLSALVPEYRGSILLVSRESCYFAGRPDLENSYRDVARIISKQGTKNIGLDTGGIGNLWEYPLWVLSRKDGLGGPKIEHVAVKNISGSIHTSFVPDIIVGFNSNGALGLCSQ